MKALSIRQPWAWLIVNAGKDVENRTWPTSFRGQFLVHAAKGCTEREYEWAWDFATNVGICVVIPRLRDLERGGIVGEANLVGCVSVSGSEWFEGPHGFVLRDVKPLPFRPMRGALGFFDVLEVNV